MTLKAALLRAHADRIPRRDFIHWMPNAIKEWNNMQYGASAKAEMKALMKLFRQALERQRPLEN